MKRRVAGHWELSFLLSLSRHLFVFAYMCVAMCVKGYEFWEFPLSCAKCTEIFTKFKVLIYLPFDDFIRDKRRLSISNK